MRRRAFVAQAVIAIGIVAAAELCRAALRYRARQRQQALLQLQGRRRAKGRQSLWAGPDDRISLGRGGI
jgi:hypothetical protein